MTDNNPIRSAGREMKRKEELGTDEPCCLMCGVRDWEMHTHTVDAQWLLERGIAAKLLEEHHVLGKAYDESFTVTLCRNCHALVTEDQRRAGITLRPAPDNKTRLRRQLYALAIFHEREAEILRRLASDAAEK